MVTGYLMGQLRVYYEWNGFLFGGKAHAWTLARVPATTGYRPVSQTLTRRNTCDLCEFLMISTENNRINLGPNCYRYNELGILEFMQFRQ